MTVSFHAALNKASHAMGQPPSLASAIPPYGCAASPLYTSEMQLTAPRGFIGILSPMIPRWESVSARLLDCRAATKVVCE